MRPSLGAIQACQNGVSRCVAFFAKRRMLEFEEILKKVRGRVDAPYLENVDNACRAITRVALERRRGPSALNSRSVSRPRRKGPNVLCSEGSRLIALPGGSRLHGDDDGIF